MPLYCDFACLVKFDRTDGAHIVRSMPEDYPPIERSDSLSWCCFPEASAQTESVHTSNIGNQMCFHWCFVYNDERYAVTVVSHHFFAAPFVKLLQDARRALKDASPDDRIDTIWNCISKWTREGEYVQLHTPLGRYVLDNIGEFVTFSQFDPTFFFGNRVDFSKVWDALMTRAGVLVVGDSPALVSHGVMSLLSLVAPLRFCDPVLSYTRLGDPRFSDVINGSTEWSVVGTTNILALERCNQFEVVLRIPQERGEKTEAPRSTLKTRTKRVLALLRSAMNSQLDRDPYWDLLGREIQSDRLHFESPLERKKLDLFLKTAMFRDWQIFIAAREEFRDAFLSALPEQVVSGRSLDTLQKMEAALDIVESKYKTDGHMMAVIACHRHFIRREKRKLSLSV